MIPKGAVPHKTVLKSKKKFHQLCWDETKTESGEKVWNSA